MVSAEAWDRLTRAVYLYKGYGYKFVEVPWYADKETLDITRPPNKEGAHLKNMEFVASAEQSFLQLIKDGRLSKTGKYVGISPCFRDEKEYDEGNAILPCFMKVELMCVKDLKDFGSTSMFMEMCQCVQDAIKVIEYFTFTNKWYLVDTKEGVDIYINGYEVGSYGIRQDKNLGIMWAYGTGLAEPRFSTALIGKN